MKMSSEIICGIRYFLCEEGFFHVLSHGSRMKNFLLNFYFYFLLFSRKQNFFLCLKEKSNKKEANNLRQVDRLCAWGVYHAKPDEATLPILESVASFIGSLWE